MLRIASDLIAEDNSLFKKGMNFPIIEKVYIQFHRPSLLKAQNEELTFSIDMFERLPTPWGLVRSGVVPDHPKIKTVSKVFKKIANEDGFRLFANVEMGKGVLLKEIRQAYDSVVICHRLYCRQKARGRGVDLPNCLSAVDFVPRYNAHSDFTDVKVDPDTDTAVVICVGNVARMLAIDPPELDPTDTAKYVLPVFKSSKIRKALICGPRSPEHAAFNAPELRDLPKLEYPDVYIDEALINEANLRVEQMGQVERDLKNNLETMRLIAEPSKKGVEQKLDIKFLAAPIKIKCSNKVEDIVFALNWAKIAKLLPAAIFFQLRPD